MAKVGQPPAGRAIQLSSGWRVRVALWSASTAVLLPALVLAQPAAPPVVGEAVLSVPKAEAPAVSPPMSCDMPAEVTAAIHNAEAACLGRPIAGRELQGCIGTRCQSPVAYKRLLSLIDLTPGSTLRLGQIATARCRLLKTGFFRVPQVWCRLVSGQARVAFKVEGNSQVRWVEFRGNEKVYTDELETKLAFQPGDVLNLDTAAGKRQLAAQAEAVRNLYIRQGYDSVRVEIRTRVVGVGKIGLIIEVSEGEQRRVSSYEYLVRGRQRVTDFDRQAALFCRPVRERDIRRIAELDDLDIYTRRAGRKARRNIRQWLRAQGYGNPRIELRHHRRDRRVSVDVRLGRCAVVHIFERETGSGDRGFRLSDDVDLLGALPFAESGVFDVDEAERGRGALRTLLENRGYLFATVRMEVREVPRHTRSQVDAAVTYWITSGYPAQIRGMSFPGSAHFDFASLLAEIGTRPYDLFDIGGYLQTESLFADLEHLRLFYRDHGYFEFGYKLLSGGNRLGHGRMYRRNLVEGDDEVFEFQRPRSGFRVRRPIGEHHIYVEVPLEEGRRSRLKSVTIEGAKQVQRSQLLPLFNLRKGDIISFNLLLEGLRAVEAHYRSLGFFNAHFDVGCRAEGASAEAVVEDATGLGPDKGKTDFGQWGACSAKRMLAEKVEVNLKVQEGKRVRMGEVFVSGNFETDEDVITRDLPRAGEDFSSQRLFDAQRRLRNLGLFRSVSFSYIGLDEKPVRDQVGLLIRVVEKPSTWLTLEPGFQTINVEQTTRVSPAGIDLVEHLTAGQQRLTVGYGQRVGVELPSLLLVGDMSVRNDNFLGAGKQLSLFGRVGWIPNLEWPQLVQGALEYMDRRLMGSDVTLRLMLPYGSIDTATMTIDVQKAGSAAEVSKRFGSLYLATGLDVAAVRFKAKVDESFNPTGLQVKIIPRLSYDSLDSGLNPTRGLFASASLAWINALLIDSLGNDQGQHNFLKFEGTAKYFFTLARRVTIGTLLHAGWGLKLDTGGGAQLPETERFRLGGQLGLRGYDDGGIPQYDGSGQALGVAPSKQEKKDGLPFACAVAVEADQPGQCSLYAAENDGDVVLNGSIESRFPVVRKWNLFGALFWDWGGIAGDWSTLHASSIRHGVGLGIRLLVSEQIPIRLDWGFSLGDRCIEPVPAATAEDVTSRACVKEDFGKLNAGLMYAF